MIRIYFLKVDAHSAAFNTPEQERSRLILLLARRRYTVAGTIGRDKGLHLNEMAFHPYRYKHLSSYEDATRYYRSNKTGKGLLPTYAIKLCTPCKSFLSTYLIAFPSF